MVISNYWLNVLFLLFIKCNMCKGKLIVMMRDLVFLELRLYLCEILIVENYYFLLYLRF